MEEIVKPFCQKGDWIILKEEFIKVAYKIYPYKSHCPGKVESIECFINNSPDITILSEGGHYLTRSKYFRFATEKEIKKYKLKNIFQNKGDI